MARHSDAIMIQLHIQYLWPTGHLLKPFMTSTCVEKTFKNELSGHASFIHFNVKIMSQVTETSVT